MHDEPGGGDYVGIDPQLLKSMISSMGSSAGTALNLVNGYIGRFSQLGIDTSGLTRASKDLSWAQDQTPMLNRRYSLAEAMEQQDPSLGPMVPGGAGALDFATNSAAQAAGKAAGTKALQALEQHENDDFVLDDLSAYSDDPAYLAAYFEALGPQGLTALGLQVNGYQQQGQNDQFQGWSTAVGDALATASYQMPYKQDWLSQLQLPNSISDGVTPQLGLIQPFLDHGVYSSAWLQPLGQYAVQQAYIQGQEPGMGLPVQLDGIWTAMSHNPAFDAQFYSQNFTNGERPDDSLYGIMTNPMLVNFIDDSAFAGMVKSATIPPAGSTDTGPFAANAQLTVRTFGDDPGARTSGAVRQALGNVAMFYFKDMLSSVGSAAPGIGMQIGNEKIAPNIPGLQVTASSGEWATFLDEAMRDKTASAQFLTFYSAWRNQFGDNQSPWSNEQFKLMDSFVVHQYQVAGEPAGDSSQGISDIVAAGGSAFITGLLFGPEATVGELLLDATKDGFQSGVENEINGAFDNGDDLSNPVTPQAIKNITDANSNWERVVRNWYNEEGGKPAQGVTYNGHSASGEPQYYISKFGGSKGGADFLDKDGKILPLNDIQMHPTMLAAYNAWLQDGAIADGLIPGVSPHETVVQVFQGQASDSGN